LLKNFQLPTYGTLSGALLVRNYLLGDVTGGDIRAAPRQASTLSVLDNTWATIDSMHLLIPGNVLIPGVVVVLCLALAVVLHILNKKKNVSTEISRKSDKYLPYLLVAVTAVYLISLVVLRSITNFEEIRIRYIAVVSPFLIILLFYWVADTSLGAWRNSLAFVASSAGILLIVLQGGLLCIKTSNYREAYGEPRYPMIQSKKGYFYNDLAAPERAYPLVLITENLHLGEDDLILTEEPELWSFITGRRFRRLKGGINEDSLRWLAQQDDKGAVLVLRSESRRALASYLSVQDDGESPYLVVPLPLQKAAHTDR